jgi:hypothetical protein
MGSIVADLCNLAKTSTTFSKIKINLQKYIILIKLFSKKMSNNDILLTLEKLVK